MPLRKVPNTEDNKKWIKDFSLVWTIVWYKPIKLWLRDLCLLYSLASLVFGALDDIRKMKYETWDCFFQLVSCECNDAHFDFYEIYYRSNSDCFKRNNGYYFCRIFTS